MQRNALERHSVVHNKRIVGMSHAAGVLNDRGLASQVAVLAGGALRAKTCPALLMYGLSMHGGMTAHMCASSTTGVVGG